MDSRIKGRVGASDVDREPAPHLRSAPTARAPRLVTVAACVDELVARPVDVDPARPTTRLFEMSLADRRRRRGARGARAAPVATLAVDADCGRERVEDEIQR